MNNFQQTEKDNIVKLIDFPEELTNEVDKFLLCKDSNNLFNYLCKYYKSLNKNILDKLINEINTSKILRKFILLSRIGIFYPYLRLSFYILSNNTNFNNDLGIIYSNNDLISPCLYNFNIVNIKRTYITYHFYDELGCLLEKNNIVENLIETIHINIFVNSYLTQFVLNKNRISVSGPDIRLNFTNYKLVIGIS